VDSPVSVAALVVGVYDVYLIPTVFAQRVIGVLAAVTLFLVKNQIATAMVRAVTARIATVTAVKNVKTSIQNVIAALM